MKHILHVIQSLEFGGAEKVVVQLANAFSNEYKVSICVTKVEGELSKELNKNVTLFSLGMGEGNDPRLIGKIKQLIIDNKVDIVHCHDWGVFVEGVVAAKSSKRAKAILTAHGPYTEYEDGIKSTIKIFIRHVIERYLSKSVLKIVAVSEAIKKYIINDIKINKNNICVIHNGVAGYDYGSNFLEKKCKKFITVGRVAAVKNHKFMLDSFKIFILENNDVSLTVVGDGPELVNIKKYADEISVSNHVEFLGFRNDVEDILKVHDVFLLSSNYEGISIAGLEAMSLGMPIISTNVGGMSEMIKQNVSGILIEEGNQYDYSSALNTLCHNEDLFNKMRISARALYVKEFQESATISKYKKLYDQV